MEYLSLNRPALNLPFWGLIRDNRYSDQTEQAFGCLFSKLHRCSGKWIDGLMLFASPVHAEIYRLWLQARGESGWRLFCTTDSDIVRILGNLRNERLQLWIAAGFAASETQQLLVDENGLLMTSSIGIDIALSRDEEDNEPPLRIPFHAFRILKELSAGDHGMMNTVGDEKYGRRAACEDEAWEERAFEALDRIATRDYLDYQKDWGTEPPSVALAQFDRSMERWLFIGSTANQWH